MRFGQMLGAFLSGAWLLSGCGGASRHDDVPAGSGAEPAAAGASRGGSNASAGSDSGGRAAGGAGAEPTTPTLHGVPIGDCRVPDAAGNDDCPAEPPSASTPCQAPAGPRKCAYDLQVSEGRATQLVYTCDPEQSSWGAFYVPCGLVCSTLSGAVIELAGDCGARQPVTCESSDTTFAFETEQQWLDSAFERVLSACLGESRYGPQFQLEVADGCGTRLSSDEPFSPEAATCLKTALDSLRWECGLRLSCTVFSAPPL